jgi:hypothetical protein
MKAHSLGVGDSFDQAVEELTAVNPIPFRHRQAEG